MTKSTSSTNESSRQTTTARRRQPQSSWANAAALKQDYNDDDEEEEDNLLDSMVTTTTTTTAVRNGARRPRLDALREQLQNEPSTTQPATQFVNGSATAKKAAKSSSTTTPSPILDMEELRRWADSLPDLPSVDDSAHNPVVLTDRFQRRHSYLRLSLTERCNLRCTYCMPPEGVPLQPASHILQTDELLQLATYFRRHGVNKFRLTGGEPTLRRDLVEICRGLSALNPKQIGMTTNGIVLSTKLHELVAAGMNSINISLDTLQPDKFASLTRRPAAYLNKVWQSLEACHELQEEQLRNGESMLTVKINCVVMRNVNTDEIADFIQLTKQFPHVSVRFIEYMPFTENGWNDEQLVPYQELIGMVEEQDNTIGLEPIPSPDPSDTTKWYQTEWSSSSKQHNVGNIGFITSMSQHFCGTCNRLRLTADGQLKVCLFDGKTELSLRDALRAGFTQQQLSKVIHAAVQQKHFKLGGHVDPKALAADVDTNRPMTLIGG